MSSGERSTRDGEAGAVAIVTALMLTLLLLFASFAIDLAQLRVDRAAGQSAADLAASAAARTYDPNAAGSAEEACEQAVAYAEANLSVTLSPDRPCSVWAGQPRCHADQAEYTGGRYRVTITIPVADGSGLMGSQIAVPEFDGVACERVGVEVYRDRSFLLAGAGGADTSSSTDMSAVGRSSYAGDDGEYASLIVLDRQTCLAVDASGAGPHDIGVRVTGWTDPVSGDYYPGIITVDSLREAGGCGNPNQIMRTTGGGEIFASDNIYSYQLRQVPPYTSEVWVGNVYTGAPASDPSHRPMPGRRIGRSPVDHHLNCLATYPSAPVWSPSHSASLSDGSSCDEAGSRPPYIRALHDRYQSLSFTDVAAANAAGWGYISGADCKLSTAVYGPASIPAPNSGIDGRRWFLDCPGVNNNGFQPTDVRFVGVDAVVTRGRVNLNNDALTVTGSSDRAAVVYLQEGSLETNSATLDFTDAFFYLNSGVVDIGAGANLNWKAPFGAGLEAACTAYDAAFDPLVSTNPAPPGSCFAPFALWTNSTAGHKMGGSGVVTVAGSFFAPNAEFNLQGGAASNYTRSQFFAGRLLFGGSGRIDMIPNPETNIAIPLTGGGLIR